MAAYYVVRRAGQIVGLYGAPQPGEPVEVLQDTAPEIAARFADSDPARLRKAVAVQFDEDELMAVVRAIAILAAQIEAMRTAAGAAAVPGFQQVANKLATIRSQFTRD